jgi:hypothetical protein
MASIAELTAVVEDLAFELILDEVEQLPGLRRHGSLPPGIKRLIPEVVAEVRQFDLIKPAYNCRIFAIEKRTLTGVQLSGGWTINSPLLIHRLAGASLLAVSVITIGDALSNRVSEK